MLQPKDLVVTPGSSGPLLRSPTSLPQFSRAVFADEQARVETAEGRPRCRRRRPVFKQASEMAMGWEAGVAGGVAGGLATAPTESQWLLRVVHVLQREGKDRGWGLRWTPSRQHLLRAHREGDGGNNRKPRHGSLRKHPPQRRGHRPPKERGEGGCADLLPTPLPSSVAWL